MQHKNSPKDTFAVKSLMESVPGRAQTPSASHTEADVQAIRELQARIEYLWGNLPVPSRADLSARLDLLSAASDHRATDSRQVRQALQDVLLSVGTGALSMLTEPTRQRLAALTGIELPDHLPPAGRRVTHGRADAGNEQADPAGRAAMPPRNHLGH